MKWLVMGYLIVTALTCSACADGYVKMVGPGAKDCKTVVEFGGKYDGAIVQCRLRFEADKVTCYVADGVHAMGMQCVHDQEKTRDLQFRM